MSLRAVALSDVTLTVAAPGSLGLPEGTNSQPALVLTAPHVTVAITGPAADLASLLERARVILPAPEAPLEAPLSQAEIIAAADGLDGLVTGLVAVDFSEILSGDFEFLLDTLSARLIGSDLGMDIGYELVGVRGYDLVFRVTLDPSAHLDLERA